MKLCGSVIAALVIGIAAGGCGGGSSVDISDRATVPEPPTTLEGVPTGNNFDPYPPSQYAQITCDQINSGTTIADTEVNKAIIDECSSDDPESDYWFVDK